ncbi:MAG: bifunctional oligoribonuclease/PAP phosphatase NrnA [Verrucomicrobia bacterium]|nr:bifunctional oligoribonuclease/PAP phosphatase NrnA [Verrucomicrobiota bacterium]
MSSECHYAELSTRFAHLLERLAGRRIAVVGHARPDGDCIGAQVALARMLMARGHDVVCINADAVPRRLQFLVDGVRFIRTDEALTLPDDRAVIFVDCADHARPGERLKAKFPSPLAVVDHHLSNVGFADCNLVDSASAATCEILAGVFLDNALPIDPQAAQALFAGILTDTGQFRFNSTSRRCFVLAGELVARGARPAEAGFELYERESVGKLQLLQRFIASLRFEAGGRICIGFLPAGIFEETKTTAEDTEGLVDYARCIDGVDIGGLIEERSSGAVKASLRAKEPAYRVDLVAAQFSGGGHACAAGLNLKSGAENFYARLVAAMQARLAIVDAAKRN